MCFKGNLMIGLQKGLFIVNKIRITEGKDIELGFEKNGKLLEILCSGSDGGRWKACCSLRGLRECLGSRRVLWSKYNDSAFEEVESFSKSKGNGLWDRKWSFGRSY